MNQIKAVRYQLTTYFTTLHVSYAVPTVANKGKSMTRTTVIGWLKQHLILLTTISANAQFFPFPDTKEFHYAISQTGKFPV